MFTARSVREKMAQGSKYTDEDIERGLQALAESGGNATAASKACGIPERTLRDWKRTKFADEFAEVRREKRTDFISAVWETAKDALQQVKDKLKDTTAKEAAVITGIMIDKALLLGGEPTEITEQRAKPMIYLPEIDELDMEAEPGASGEVSPEPGV